MAVIRRLACARVCHEGVRQGVQEVAFRGHRIPGQQRRSNDRYLGSGYETGLQAKRKLPCGTVERSALGAAGRTPIRRRLMDRRSRDFDEKSALLRLGSSARRIALDEPACRHGIRAVPRWSRNSRPHGRLPLLILPAGLNIERSWRNGRLAQTPIAGWVHRIC